MSSIFVDTSAFYALVDAGESTHVLARRTLATLERAGKTLLTTTDVLDEILTLVRYRLGHGIAVSLGERLRESNWCSIVEVTDEIREAAWSMFVRYADQTFSFTDCTSFATMQRRRLRQAFSFDHQDFFAAGFHVVPTPAERAKPRPRRR